MKIQPKQRALKPLLTTSIACFFAAFYPGIATVEDADKKEFKDEEVSVVDSGTFKVTAHVVDDKEEELFVKMADGKIIELDIKPKTKLTKGKEKVEFAV